MKYTPDHKYDKSVALIKYLTEDKPLPKYHGTINEEEMLDLLLYHIKKKNEFIDEQRKRMKEYQQVFDGIARFTNKGQTVYR